jgi:hypothetical protein
MQRKTVQWPSNGRKSTFHRAVAIRLFVGVALMAAAVAATWHIAPQSANLIAVICSGSLAIWTLWAIAHARQRAQHAEIIASFAGLHVLFHKRLFRIGARPLIGAYVSRRAAVNASLEHGSWAVIVRAYGRWYALAATPQDVAGRAAGPFSFRTAAVADVIPSVRDTAISA